MGSFKAMPCMSSSKVAILSCFTTRPQLPSHSPILVSALWGRHRMKISYDREFTRQMGVTTLSHSSRWHSCCAEASFKGNSSRKKRSPPSGWWGFESGGRDWASGSNVRTFASSPQGSEGSEGAEGVDGAAENSKNPKNSGGLNGANKSDAEKAVREGLLVGVAESLAERFNKPEVFTGDELHYVAVAGTNWRLALWRYRPPPNAPKRNHPLLMLSGIGTNATGFDLDPSVSMARCMSDAGFDTWILEVRGSGLSKSEDELSDEGKDAETSDGESVENKEAPEEEKIDPLTKSSSEPTSEKGPEAKLDQLKKRSSELTSEQGAIEKMDPPNKRSKPTSEEGTMEKMDSPTKSRESTSSEGNLSDHEGIVESTMKVARGGASWEAWRTATRLSETLLNLSTKFGKLLTKGQSKLLSARFIDTVVSLLEDSTLSKRVVGLRERLTGLLEARDSSSAVVTQIADLRKRLAQLLEDGQDAVSPRVTNLQGTLNSTIDDFQKVVDLISKYDWDFDSYLEEDVPTAMEYVRNQCNPVDGKLLSVGHSMGGIVLYARLSTRGDQSGLVGAVALASALDYQCSDTSLKLLLPLTDPAQVLNVPIVPLGALMTAVHPLVTRPPYALAWLGYQISAQNMMKTELFSKLVLNNFGTIPVKLLLHLATVFKPGGLANRDGTFKYKENIGKITVPVLAVAGDQDKICPPVAVRDTVDLFRKETITYKCFGGENNRHYGHYDIVCSPGAKEEVFPVILDFLVQNDEVKVDEIAKVEVEA